MEKKTKLKVKPKAVPKARSATTKTESKPLTTLLKARKRKSSTKITASETKTTKVTESPKKGIKAETSAEPLIDKEVKNTNDKYPVLQNAELIEKFLKVPFNNNQKGRIRQAIKMSLQGTTDELFPDIINNKIKSIISGTENLTDSDLRRIRILFNMLKTSIENASKIKNKEKKTKPKKEENQGDGEKADGEKADGDGENADGDEKAVAQKEKKEQVTKVKGPKRYVVFVGNLPLNINKEKIMDHFREMNEHVKDIRLPKQVDGKKSAIAYLELTNEPSFEFALSKHHSMLGNRRINVLYSKQKNSKITTAEAKSKTAKLIALQKSGKLVGSIPAVKKRSHRRMILKQARAKAAAETA